MAPKRPALGPVYTPVLVRVGEGVSDCRRPVTLRTRLAPSPTTLSHGWTRSSSEGSPPPPSCELPTDPHQTPCRPPPWKSLCRPGRGLPHSRRSRPSLDSGEDPTPFTRRPTDSNRRKESSPVVPGGGRVSGEGPTRNPAVDTGAVRPTDDGPVRRTTGDTRTNQPRPLPSSSSAGEGRRVGEMTGPVRSLSPGVTGPVSEPRGAGLR